LGVDQSVTIPSVEAIKNIPEEVVVNPVKMDTLNSILKAASDGFESCYGLRQPSLESGSVKVIPKIEARKFREFYYHPDNFLIKALLSLGVDRSGIHSPFEKLPKDGIKSLKESSNLIKSIPYIADTIQYPDTIFIREDVLDNISQPDAVSRDVASIALGTRLSVMALRMLPPFREVKSDFWQINLRELLLDRIHYYLNLHKHLIPSQIGEDGISRISPQARIDEATEGFFYGLLFGDPDKGIPGDQTLRFLSQGGKISVVLQQEGRDCELTDFGADFHHQLAFFSSGGIRSKLLTHFSRGHTPSERRQIKERLEKTGITQDVLAKQTKVILEKLRLRSNFEITSAFLESKIVEQYLDMLQVTMEKDGHEIGVISPFIYALL